MTPQPVLMEVAPSPANICKPAETTEHWHAVVGGGFEPRDGVSVATNLLSNIKCDTAQGVHPKLQPRTTGKSIRKKPKRLVEYYVNHCENTKCSFPHGHAGLCSHQIVIGKRGGRVSRHRSSLRLFDLNESDSDDDDGF